MLQYCGIALCALAAALALRGMNGRLAAAAPIAATLILTGAALSMLAPTLRELVDGAANTAFSEYTETLTRALGIALAVQLSAELCRDVGEGALANGLELVGRAELLLLALPLLRRLLTLAADIMG